MTFLWFYGLGLCARGCKFSLSILRGWICALRGKQQIDGNQFSVGDLFIMIKLMILEYLLDFAHMFRDCGC